MVRKAFGWLVVGVWGGALSAGCVGERFGGGEDDCTDDEECVDAGPSSTGDSTDDARDDDEPSDDDQPDDDSDDPADDDSLDDLDDSLDDVGPDDESIDDTIPDDEPPDDTNADDTNLDDAVDDSLADDDALPDDGSDDPADDGSDDASGDAGGADDPPAPGVRSDCVEPTDGPVRAYFEVPGTQDADLGDYFRLPFPNDFYRSEAGLDLGDYPTVTAASEVFVDAVNATASGFSASPTIYFRFSGRVDFETLIPRFYLRDITEPERPSSPPLKLVYSPQAGKYMCHDALSVRPTAGYALKPGRIYAAWLETGVLDDGGNPIQGSPQLASMLGDAPPADSILADLYGKYEPLRVFMDTIDLDAANVLNATVFTVDDPLRPMEQLAAAIEELPVPEAIGWVMCDEGTASPCALGDAKRACGPENPDYVEYHGVVSLPIFQQGTAPYFDSGGQISLDGPVRYENVCTAVTVPRESDGDLPVVLYSHGASGSFRSHVVPEVAGTLSRGIAGPNDDEPRRFIVVGYDGVQHGPRRGDDPQTSGISSDLLLFNFLNPTGTLGTSLQGGADVLSMGRFAKALDDVLPDDAGRTLLFMGQSQGSLQGSIALPYTNEFSGAVFTGAGAGFVPSMLARQEPAIIPTAIAQAVFDPGAEGEPVRGGEFHPALALVQHLVDPADPLHHAARLVTAPVTEPLHVFHVYGTRDRASTAIAQKTFAIAAGLGIAQPHSSVTDDEGLGEPLDAFPLVGNVTRDGQTWTAGVRQYAPAEGADGHFVAFDVEAAQLELSVFLSAVAAGEVPPIGVAD